MARALLLCGWVLLLASADGVRVGRALGTKQQRLSPDHYSNKKSYLQDVTLHWECPGDGEKEQIGFLLKTRLDRWTGVGFIKRPSLPAVMQYADMVIALYNGRTRIVRTFDGQRRQFPKFDATHKLDNVVQKWSGNELLLTWTQPLIQQSEAAAKTNAVMYGKVSTATCTTFLGCTH